MDWLSWLWSWLDANSKQIGALSQIAFGVSGVVVAIYAYGLNKRNNWGDKPQVWVPSLGGSTKDGRNFSTFEGEFWNRHKYTIYPRLIRVKFKRVDTEKLRSRSEHFHEEWMLLEDDWFYTQLDKATKVEAGQKLEFKGAIPYEGRGYELPQVKVDYFDPVIGDNLQVTQWRRRRWRFWRWHTPMMLRIILKQTKKRLFGDARKARAS